MDWNPRDACWSLLSPSPALLPGSIAFRVVGWDNAGAFMNVSLHIRAPIIPLSSSYALQSEGMEEGDLSAKAK